VLTGQYLVKWYAPVTPNGDDFCLAADHIWFVENPVPLIDVDKACGTDVSRPFRTCLRVNTEKCVQIEKLLKCMPNVIKSYLVEIDRLERFNLKYGGYKYITAKRKDSYSWHCDKVNSVLRKGIKKA
jgi:hypothetical protein